MYYSNNDAIMESYMTRSTESHSGEFSLILDHNQKSGIMYQLDSLVPGQTISAQIWRKGSNNGSLVISGPDLYNSINVPIETDSLGWKLLKINFIIPDSIKGSYQIYPWNASPDHVFFDDLKIEIQ